MITYLATVAAALVLNIFIFWLLRRGILQEKFAALWLLVAAVLLLLAIFPSILINLAAWLGVVVPANLLFFLAGLTLLAVSIQLSFEIGRVEGRTRRLAEDLALLRTEVADLKRDQGNRE